MNTGDDYWAEDSRVVLRTGLTVIAVLLLLCGAAAARGRVAGLFDDRARFSACFQDTGGLMPGDFVLLGEAAAGEVAEVRLPKLNEPACVRVEMRVSREAAVTLTEGGSAEIMPGPLGLGRAVVLKYLPRHEGDPAASNRLTAVEHDFNFDGNRMLYDKIRDFAEQLDGGGK